jgi:hypothetical protein
MHLEHLLKHLKRYDAISDYCRLSNGIDLRIIIGLLGDAANQCHQIYMNN